MRDILLLTIGSTTGCVVAGCLLWIPSATTVRRLIMGIHRRRAVGKGGDAYVNPPTKQLHGLASSYSPRLPVGYQQHPPRANSITQPVSGPSPYATLGRAVWFLDTLSRPRSGLVCDIWDNIAFIETPYALYARYVYQLFASPDEAARYCALVSRTKSS